mmetsp:Transcript_138201/g.440886  ORF Transcript_138201/g.440886 Transcript_138201/m.440886 type:complete len:304 (+) Transcript_138201:64-975(+)
MAGLTKMGRVYYGEELQGIANVAGLSVGKVAIMQVAYEVFAACTSIVVDVDASHLDRGLSGRRPFHIRTMDWEFEQLRELTIEVDFVRGGHTVFSATTWPGYVGVLTGLRMGVGSISVNYRRTPRGAQTPVRAVLENMLRGLALAWPVSFLIREALDTCTSYPELVDALLRSDLMAPTYIAIAGAEEGQGIVITRNRTFSETGDIERAPPQLHLQEEGASCRPTWTIGEVHGWWGMSPSTPRWRAATSGRTSATASPAAPPSERPWPDRGVRSRRRICGCFLARPLAGPTTRCTPPPCAQPLE